MAEQDVNDLYVSVQDVTAAMTPLTGQGRGGHSLDQGRIQRNILDAQAEVDAKLGVRYTVPFPATPDTPPIVREITQDFAIYLCTIEARGSADMKKDDPVVRRYERKLALLKEIAAGDALIPGVEPDDDAAGFVAINTIRDPHVIGL